MKVEVISGSSVEKNPASLKLFKGTSTDSIYLRIDIDKYMVIHSNRLTVGIIYEYPQRDALILIPFNGKVVLSND